MTGTGHHINWPPIGLALLLALLGFWLNHLSSRVETVDNAGFTHDPDFIVERFDALAFDTNGNPYQRLAAARMTHFMDDDTTVLDKPILRNLDPEAQVTVNAERALISSDGKQVYFLDKVHMERPAGGDRPALTLDTEYLHVSSDSRVIRTNKPVALRQGPSSITANRLIADDKAKLLSLDGNVRGTYENSR
jgi:lipopolysaccharide export system protein LptC